MVSMCGNGGKVKNTVGGIGGEYRLMAAIAGPVVIYRYKRQNGNMAVQRRCQWSQVLPSVFTAVVYQ